MSGQRPRSLAKALRCPSLRLGRLDVTVLGVSVCDESAQEHPRYLGDVVNGVLEHFFVGRGRLGESAQLANEL